ncbi:hypothetical protein OUZ56_011554 [Daphnia magna]|uniref:Uncharacterized protein n=1 Tax=Daphnia magna TaxID=35525 RepID=A0ABQ9Z1R3_9CRUS|nr:hypothetical protein OUZ56_011554 [Daphnia magna]
MELEIRCIILYHYATSFGSLRLTHGFENEEVLVTDTCEKAINPYFVYNINISLKSVFKIHGANLPHYHCQLTPLVGHVSKYEKLKKPEKKLKKLYQLAPPSPINSQSPNSILFPTERPLIKYSVAAVYCLQLFQTAGIWELFNFPIQTASRKRILTRAVQLKYAVYGDNHAAEKFPHNNDLLRSISDSARQSARQSAHRYDAV